MINNGLNMLNFDGSIMYHVDSFKNVKQIINPL
jgi:hypothetical protein